MKTGDFIYWDAQESGGWVTIFNRITADGNIMNKFATDINGICYTPAEQYARKGEHCLTSMNCVIACRLATPAEIDMLLAVLEKGGYTWNREKLCLEKLQTKQYTTLKPFDKVLVRDRFGVNSNGAIWHTDLFSHMAPDGKFVTVGGVWDYCIPYPGNETLIGTSVGVI